MIVKRKTASGLRYMARVYVGKDANGNQVLRNGPTRDTRQKAQEDELELQRFAERTYITANTVKVTTFPDAVELFRGSKKYRDYTPRTLKDYNYWLRKELMPVFGHAKLSAIKTQIIEKWTADMNDRMSPATWHKPMGFMKQILLYARKQGYMTFDPFQDAELPSTTVRGKALRTDEELVVWTPEQIKSFMYYDAVQRDYIYPMLQLSFNLGMRPGEVCGLKVRDVGADMLTIAQGISRDGSETDLKTEASHRRLPLSPELRASLLQAAGKRSADDYIFRNLKGNPVNPDVYGKRFQALIGAYNRDHDEPLPQMRLYNTRHSWSTNAKFVYGMDPAVRAAIMGHTSISTSDENYTKISKKQMEGQLSWY